MFRSLTESRLSTALALVFFVFVFLISVSFVVLDANSYGLPSLTTVITIFGSVIGSVGTICTVILAWRADRRTARESDLKVVQLKQQITELQRKLNASPPSSVQ
jgi:hypothetical protein